MSRAPYDPGELSETASEIFRLLGERLGWEVGVLWAVEKDALRCGGIWRAEGRAPSGFEEACRGSDFRRGEGLPGRVWRLGEACWVEDVLEDEGFLSRGVAEGLRCALALPIQDGGRLFGVFELLKGEVTPVEDLLRAAYLSGNWIGQFVERRRVAAPAGCGRGRRRPRPREGSLAAGYRRAREHQRCLFRRRRGGAVDLRQPPGHVRDQVFLVLREAVRNAMFHSGCGSLSVGLDIAPKGIVGSVEDDGRGFDPADGDRGVGLRSMRERAALLDGALRLDCGPGRGTRVEVSVPLAGGR